MKTIKTATKLTLKMIRKGSDDIVTITHPTLKSITKKQFEQIQAETLKANGNKVLSYEIEYAEKEVMTRKTELFSAGIDSDNTVSNMSRMGE